tara:strand:+ start:483 stop:644 length:162 start_codon:yes stop_codon:yes gene_type:complete
LFDLISVITGLSVVELKATLTENSPFAHSLLLCRKPSSLFKALKATLAGKSEG